MRTLVIAAALVAALVRSATAETETAWDLLREFQARNVARDPTDLAVTIEMRYFLAGELRFVRDVRSYTKRYEDGTFKTLVVFLGPFDVQGIRLLSWSDPRAVDLQWLYLPAFGRVRRVPSSLQSNSFQGSALSYEDVNLFERIRTWSRRDGDVGLAKSDDTVDGVPCAVVALTPLDETLSYRRIVLWVHPPDATLRRAEFFDKDERPTKNAVFRRFQQVEGVPTAFTLEIEDVSSGERTILETRDVDFKPGLTDDHFSPAGLDQTR